MISKLEMHEDILSPWRGKCDSNQCPGSLVAMTFTQISRGQGLIPIEAKNIFGSLIVTYSTHCYMFINFVKDNWVISSFRHSFNISALIISEFVS